jgi:2,4-dienoyl-CoA reductase-like NADH-dependent reductase (Old Yellow Enzyme family)
MTKSKSNLFESFDFKNISIKNRLIRSATWEGLATDRGTVTKPLIQKMLDLIDGGVGLIITGHAYVSPEGKASFRQLGVYSDHLIPGLTDLVEQCHQAGGKVILQIAHGGVQSKELQEGYEAFGPSDFSLDTDQVIRAMTIDNIDHVIQAFAAAATRAQKAGFDGIQLHAAHGYLLSQFLSPFYNHRQDKYGGTLENRMRIIEEIILSIQTNTSSEFPIFIKINSEDFLDNGFTTDEMIAVVKKMEKLGIVAVELSGGTGHSKTKFSPVRRTRIKSESDEGFFINAARRLKSVSEIPVILVGGIKTQVLAEKLINNGVADCISFCRPLICEPDLVNLWKEGRQDTTKCLRDNLCFLPASKGEGIYCVSRKKGRIK